MAYGKPDVVVHFGADTKKLDRAVKGVGRDFKKIGQIASAAFAGVAGSAIAAYTRDMFEAIRVTNRWAQALNVPIKQLSAMGYATKTVGISTEALADKLKDLSEKITEAYVTGGGEAAEALDQLGISAEDLVRLNPADQLLAIADALSEVANYNQRVLILEALANDATVLGPLLDNNAEKLRELMRTAEESGATLTEEMARTTEDIDRRWREMTTSMSSAFRGFVFDFIDGWEEAGNIAEKGIAAIWDRVLRWQGNENLADQILGDWYTDAPTTLPPIEVVAPMPLPTKLPPAGGGTGGTGGGGGSATENTEYADTIADITQQYRALENALNPVLAIEREMEENLNLLDMAAAALSITESEYAAMQSQIIEDANTRIEQAGQLIDEFGKEKEAIEEVSVSWETMGTAAGSTLGNIVTGANAAEQAIRLLGRVVEFAFEKFLLPSIFSGFSGVTPAATGMAMPGGSSLGQGVVSSPTLFTFAKGGKLGLMGEAGPEAILPLSKGPTGNLGVEASGLGTVVNVHNYGADVQTRDRGDGEIDIIVRRITGEIARGGTPLARSLESSYGLTRGRLRG